MSRLASVAGVVSVAVLAGGVPALAEASHGHRPGHKLTLFARTVQQEDLDLGTPGTSLGDRTVFSHDVSRRRHGRAIGEDGGECTIVRIDEEFYDTTLQCVVTLRLRAGQLTVQGLARFPGGMVPDRFKLAVTGGTGRFTGAGGTVTVHTLSDTRFRYVFRLRH